MKKLILIISLLCMPFLAGCDLLLPSMTINYKVTVEIETPEGVKSGYAVRQISSRAPLFRFPESGNPAIISGEAVVIDLGKGGKVFALMSDQSWRNALYRAFKIKGPATHKGIRYYKSLKIGEKAEWHDFKPKFVTFKDITDPKSFALLREEEQWNDDLKRITAEDHFEEILKRGISLKSITVEITDEPVTWGRVIESLPNKKPVSGMQRFIKGKQK